MEESKIARRLQLIHHTSVCIEEDLVGVEYEENTPPKPRQHAGQLDDNETVQAAPHFAWEGRTPLHPRLELGRRNTPLS